MAEPKKKKVAVVQSNYIPWKGYFDLIHSVDEFILFDDMQYTKRDWRNRNRIKTPRGAMWLTIPVAVKKLFKQKICDTVVRDPGWNKTHWESIRHHYARAKHYADYESALKRLYLQCDEQRLSRINHRFLEAVCAMLGIQSKLSWSMDYDLIGGKTERLLHLCKQAGAGEYVSGPSAKAYLDEALFEKEGIRVTYMDYSGYKEYAQLFPPFIHEVSILDLLLNEGPDAKKYLLSFKAS